MFFSIQVYAENNDLDKYSREPMVITANSMEAFINEQRVVFSGNAKVTQGKSVFKSDRLILHYREADQKENKGAIHREKAGNMEKIEAQGNVYLNHDQRIVTGDEALYLRDSHQIIMTGNATLREGKNFIKGDKVIFFLNENRGFVEGDKQHKVKAVIYPRDMRKTDSK